MTDIGASERAQATPAALKPLNLESCAQELIHLPGAIQPQGALLACEQRSLTVLSVSANAQDFFGRTPAQVRQPLGSLLDPHSVASIRGALEAAFVRPYMPSLVALRLHDGRELQGNVHAHGGVVYVEVGPTAQDHVQAMYTVLQNTYPVLGSMTEADSLESMLTLAASYVKRVTGLDRVMVYRFDEHWHGEVIEEQCTRADVPLYFGLRFPASDIPSQARALYRTGLIRYIADVSYTAVPLVPLLNPRGQLPFDLSYCTFRSVSPVHLQYLKNMGVSSTLVVSIVVDGELWGLISCHHYAPTALSLVQRQICGMVALVAGAMVKSLQDKQQSQQRVRRAALQLAIMQAFGVAGRSVQAALKSAAVSLTKLMDATGGALWLNDEVMPFGHTPHPEVLATLIKQARAALASVPERPWHCTHLGQPGAGTPVLGGGLAIALDPQASKGLIWLRPELRQLVLWGGNPDEPATQTDNGDGSTTISPRQSFESWKQTVQGQCAAWTAADLEAAASLRPLELVLDTHQAVEMLHASEEKFRGLAGLSSDAYWETDAQHRFTQFETGRLGAMGLHLAPLGGPLAASFLPDASDGEPLPVLMAHHRVIRELDCHAALPDGRRLPLTLNAEPIYSPTGAFFGYRGTLSDASVRRAADAVRVERDAAVRANVAKSIFVSHMSHELRTPLTAVLGYGQLLDTSEKRPLDIEQRAWVKDLLKAGNHMLQMVEDLLDLSLVEAGQLKLRQESVDFKSLVADVIRMLDATVTARALQVTVDVDNALVERPLLADAKRLRQVMLNLISNAVKYNVEGGSITVTARNLDAAKGGLHVEVADTGVGISQVDLRHLFEPFNRFGHDRGVFAGTGIGLVISRRLVQAMGGQLTATSTPLVGTTFSFSMPAAPVA